MRYGKPSVIAIFALILGGLLFIQPTRTASAQPAPETYHPETTRPRSQHKVKHPANPHAKKISRKHKWSKR